MSIGVSTLIAPLIKRNIFSSEEQAVRELLNEHIVRQVTGLRRRVARFERKHGMRFEQFACYLHERSNLLAAGGFSPEELQILGQAVMQDEDDWLDWKAATEMLDSWIGLSGETAA